MTSSDDTQQQPKKHAFAPRSLNSMGFADSINASHRQRRFLRNIILGAVLIISGLIALALVFYSEEDIKVQVTAEPQDIEKAPTSIDTDISVSSEVKGLTFKGITANGNNFTVLAETAIESKSQPELIMLKSPRARVGTNSGRTITLQSLNGTFDRNKNSFDLNGNVVIIRPDIGYTLRTDAAVVDLNTERMVFDQEVHGSSPRTKVRADGMVISEKDNEILFTGKSTLQLLAQQSN